MGRMATSSLLSVLSPHCPHSHQLYLQVSALPPEFTEYFHLDAPLWGMLVSY